MTPQIYLASKSPRRQELLQQLGVRHVVLAADIPEHPAPAESPAQYAMRIAEAKARAVLPQAALGIPILGADTDVVLDGRILGKPMGREDATAMLLALSGREHEVYSAVALLQGDRVETALSVTRVQFGAFSPQAAAAYWESGEPAGKAGAYAIQGLGAQFIRAINGSYSGVVGLPLFETVELLNRFDIKVLA